jgi:hypothetical protein
MVFKNLFIASEILIYIGCPPFLLLIDGVDGRNRVHFFF